MKFALLVTLAAIQFERAPDLGFILHASPTPDKHLPETMAGGVAVFDFNRDGRPDIFFANGAEMPSLRKTGPRFSNRLFRNDGGWKFTDVTAQAGVAGEGFAFGAAAGDFDGDGYADLFVPALPVSHLYRNRGDGTFEDITTRSRIETGPWTIAAGWLDYDNDGRLDLFVVNYLDWSPRNNPWCGDKTRNLRVYCHPNQFRPTANQLFRNRGDGTFEDVSRKSGIAAHLGKGMSLSIADYDSDGYADVYVTNDVLPNFLFHNRRDGTFEEVAMRAGVALPERGRAISAMGTDFQDYDNDGRADLVVAALAGETFPLFRNLGPPGFEETTAASGITGIAARMSGWAPVFADFDNDGRKDLFISASHVNDRIAETAGGRYELPNAVLRNRDGKTFEEVTGGAMKQDIHAHRGAAVADFDGDGRLDILVTVLNGSAELWRNVSPLAGHWIAVNAPAGAQVRVAGQTTYRSLVSGYASSNLSPLHFGLGERTSTGPIEIRLPDGRVRRLPPTAVDRVID